MRIRRRDVLKAVAAPLVAGATRAFGFTQDAYAENRVLIPKRGKTA